MSEPLAMTDAQIPPPAVPGIIQQLMSKLSLPYQMVLDNPNIDAAQRVQAMLLDDQVGALLVLFPQSHLLDLAALNELTGRKLNPVRQERLDRMLGKHKLDGLPGLPPLTSSPCIYEEGLLSPPTVLIDSGHKGVLLEMPTPNFKSLLSKASSARFAVPLAQIQPNLDRPDDDREEITQAVQNFTARRIRQRLEETLEIPPLAETAQKIIKLRVDPDATVEDITGVVETDPALAAQVVSWAASPYYAAPGKIRSVEDAIVRVLGFDLVINLALGLALGKSLSLPKDGPQKGIPYWDQAIYTAAVIEGLTRAIPRPQRPEAGLSYLAGLLHNFGYLVLAHVFPPHFSLICRHMEANPHVPHNVLEQHLLGISREQMGGWLMRFWDMPEEIATALRFQHDPSYRGAHHPYANLVCLATRLLHQRGIGGDSQEPIPAELYQALNIEPDKALEAVNKVMDAEVALRELISQFHQSGG